MEWLNSKKMPVKAIDALKIWDSGEPLWSVKMGGFGPTYELCIQFSAFELIRAFKGIILQGCDAVIDEELDRALSKIDDEFNLGHSELTAGASKILAYSYMKVGYRKTLEYADKKQIIQVDNNWQHKPKHDIVNKM